MKFETGAREEKLKKEADHSRLAGGCFNKQGNLHTRLSLIRATRSRSLHRPARILKSLLRALKRALSSGGFQQHLTVSRLRPWNWLLVWEEKAGGTF